MKLHIKIFHDLIVKALVLLVRIYQVVLSPILPSSCRFEPSCSTFCIQSLQKDGLLKGIGRSVWRILRCNPFNKGGYDPV